MPITTWGVCALFVDQGTIDAARESGHWARTLQRIFRGTLDYARTSATYAVLASSAGKFKAAVSITYPRNDKKQTYQLERSFRTATEELFA